LKVIEVFNNLVINHNCSLIIATHDMDVANLQDRILSIEELNS